MTLTKLVAITVRPQTALERETFRQQIMAHFDLDAMPLEDFPAMTISSRTHTTPPDGVCGAGVSATTADSLAPDGCGGLHVVSAGAVPSRSSLADTATPPAL